MKPILLTLLLAVLTGCATRSVANKSTQDNHDARMTRGLMDSMASQTHRFPGNLPR